MIKNSFRLAIRSISRNKGFTIINVSGLATGLAAALLILLWIQEEFSYEKFNLNAEHIYRVEEDQFYSGERYHVTVTPHPSGPVWKERIPEIVDQTRINRFPRLLFRLDDKVFFESAVISADSGLFQIFTLPLLLGDPSTVLESPHSIVLSEKLAKKYFGDSNPLGQSLTIENKYNFMVSGVMKDLPRNSMFTFEAVLPYSFLEEIGMMNNSWGTNSIQTFVQLERGSDIAAVNTKLTDVVLEYLPQTTTKYLLFPLLDIHLHSQFGFEQNNGPVVAIIIFTTIAVLLILIASINFINLSTARASTRAKEVGIRKVAGADRKSMIVRFMSESLLLVVFASILSLVLVGLSLGLFNSISGKRFVISDLFQLKFILSFVSAVLLTGIFAGIYPALYLSSFKPVAVLKGEGVQGRGSGRLRQILVVIQFTLSILITVTTVFLYIQLKFLQRKNLGFDKENLICIQMAENMKDRYYLLKNELLQHSLIEGVTASTRNPVMIGSNSGGASWDGKDPEKRVLIGTNGIDYDYLETMRMELVSGRSFSRDFQGDLARDTTGNFLVNEEVARIMDVGDPVGKNFRFMGISGTIVGVLKNFHFKGADEPIEPIAFALTGTSFLNAILIKLTPGKTNESLKIIENTWSKLIPEYPLDYSFVEQDYENLFRQEIRLTRLLGSFTVLTLIIACLGLYGLSSYSAERRTNEVGIRKVMGAETASIVFTMTKEFLSLVAIAIILSFPAGYFLVKKLLDQFAFRIDLNPAVFMLIALGSLAVALFTVSFHAYKASGVNPAEALKAE
ncbi:MAG: ABC transporter permease [Bacteroidales bacterium]